MKKLSLILVLFLAFFATNVQADSLGSKLKGKILLQVEENGEAWYLSPVNEKRYFMGRPHDAFQLMNELGVGISNQDLNKIPVDLGDIDALDSDGDGLPDFLEKSYGTDINKADSDGDGFKDGDEVKDGFNPNGSGKLNIDSGFAKKHQGKIFLQVEGRGEAWYINPGDFKRYFLGRPADAFRVMKKLGLGIKNSDIENIAKMTDVSSDGVSVINSLSSNDTLIALQKQKEIKKFANETEFAEYLENQSTFSNYSYSPAFRSMPELGLDSASSWGEATNEAQSTTGLASKSSADYSKTNIQVEGVDEADIIKTDGNYVYALVEKTLFVMDAYPAEDAKILSQIEFEDQPQNIYINDDRLVVFGHDYSHRKNELYSKFIRRSSFTFFKIFDISDRNNPKQIKDLNFEGSYSSSRMIGDYVYFISNNYNYGYYDTEPALPRIISDNTVLRTSCTASDCINPDIYYFDVPYTSYNAVSINAINIKDINEKINGDIYLLESGQNFYVSENNIYLTYTKYLNEYQLMMEISKDIVMSRLSAKNQELIKKIEDTDKLVLSHSEKQTKINAILSTYSARLSEDEQESLEKEVTEAMKKRYEDISKELEKTVIHKIAIDKGSLEYKSNGEVTGRVLNQFSMDESGDGHFRIATTKGRTWSVFDEASRTSYNNMYVLDKDLTIVGSLEGLAKDERIKSVRFMQDRAYMVTFKQIDPLFVIDLTTPTNPKVLGELKIPGYSDYLHPYNDTILIGLGKDAYENENGRTVTGGLKLSLFDVSDVSSPKEIDNYIMGESGSYSPALSDHKAFYFDSGKKIIGIPAALRDKDTSTYTFNGAIMVNVSEEGFDLRGKIAHENNTGKTQYYYYGANVKRILHIGDTLYTFSNGELKMNKLSNLEDIGTIKFKDDEDDITIKTNPQIIEMPMIDADTSE